MGTYQNDNSQTEHYQLITSKYLVIILNCTESCHFHKWKIFSSYLVPIKNCKHQNKKFLQSWLNSKPGNGSSLKAKCHGNIWRYLLHLNREEINSLIFRSVLFEHSSRAPVYLRASLLPRLLQQHRRVSLVFRTWNSITENILGGWNHRTGWIILP